MNQKVIVGNTIKKHHKFFRKSVLNKRSKLAQTAFIIVFIIFCIYAFTLIFPFLWMLMSSLKDSAMYEIDITIGKPFRWPEILVWSNYAAVFNKLEANGTSYFGMFFNSVWYSVIACTLSVLMPSIVGYCLSKFDFRGRNFLYALAIFSMTIPLMGNMGAAYKLYGQLKLFDNPLFVVITNLGGLGGMNFMIFYGFFKNISWSYVEAVYIDGGGDYTAFFRIMLPQALPMMITLFIMSFIGTWNDYMTVILYLPSYPTIASGMYTVANTLQRTGQTPVYFAGLIVSMIPVLVLFFIFSDKMLTSVSFGGIKG